LTGAGERGKPTGDKSEPAVTDRLSPIVFFLFVFRTFFPLTFRLCFKAFGLHAASQKAFLFLINSKPSRRLAAHVWDFSFSFSCKCAKFNTRHLMSIFVATAT
jgi:hypothetical protein